MNNDIEKKTLQIPQDEIDRSIKNFLSLRLLYQSALREINTKFEILNDEFQSMHEYNPIEHIKSRVKSPKSILEKLMRRGLPVSVISANENLTDIAGIRVICSFIEDIYMIADMLSSQTDVVIIRRTDYIKNPKPNGYRSLHLIVEIPVFFSNKKENVKVEIQIRTEAMDFWASLEHKLHYKANNDEILGIVENLKECSEQINLLDKKMMAIHKQIQKFNKAQEIINNK